MSTPFTPDPSCQDDPAKTELVPVARARAALLSAVSVVGDREDSSLSKAVGRVLAEDVIAEFSVPGHDNSAMDGFALRGSELPQDGSVSAFEVVDAAWAGQPARHDVKSGQAIQVATGAVMPTGADTVVIQERVQRDGDLIRVLSDERPGANVRMAGEDIGRGDIALPAGTSLGPAEIGFLASLGVAQVSLFRRLRVALFSTGDELVALSEGVSLKPGQVFDSNRHSLRAALAALNVEIVDMGIVPDDVSATRTAFSVACQEADAVIATGGASVSDADHVASTLREMGEVTFWRVAMRPGRPLTSGRVGGAQFFGLPGNPVATLVSFYQFVLPALKQMMGMTQLYTPSFKVKCVEELKKSVGRVEYQRGVLMTENGEPVVRSTGRQGAGRLSSMVLANCFIVLAPEQGRVSPGDWVEVQPFEGLTA